MSYDNDKISVSELARILREQSDPFNASLQDTQSNNPVRIQTLVLDLSTAKDRTQAFSISSPFVSLYMDVNSTSGAQVYFIPDNNDNIQSPILITRGSSIEFSQPIRKGFLYWTAQAGKSANLVLFVNGKINNNTIETQVTSSVDGSSITEKTSVSLSSTSSALIDNSTRNVITLYNAGPNEAWVGSSGCSAVGGSELGARLPVGAERVYKNTAALYGASKGTSKIIVQVEA